MKITEAERRHWAFFLIANIAACGESIDPERDWKESHDALSEIYRIAHSINSPKCRENHQGWIDPLDKFIRYQRAMLAERAKKP